jgi:hypothetical protein
MSNYIDRAKLLESLTHIHERTVESPFIGGAVLIREPTVRERMAARDAAQGDSGDPDQFDTALYHAMLIHRCVVDSNSGTTDPRTGRIDPRTRVPLFSVSEALDIAEGRQLAVSFLIEQISDLAALLPLHFKSGDPAADSRERDAGSGPEERGD